MNGASFFQPARTITAGEIAELTGAKLSGAADAVVRGVAALDRAGEGDLVFADGKGKAPLLRVLRAAAVLASADLASEIPASVAVLISQAPQRDFAAVARALYPEADRPASLCGTTGISPAAHIHPTAAVEDGATVDPGAVVGPFAQVGSGSVIAPNAVVGPRCTVGRGCFIGPNSTVQNAILGNAVVIHAGVHIGQDGFGYVLGRGGPEKMPQLGRVVIQDRVEIGAGTTIDRGALGDTVIGENTKIDNLVQIAHNCRIGRNCVIASHSGISGSVTIGDNAMLGGRVGIADHMTVGDNVQLGAASGVMSDVPAGARWGGFPAQPLREWLRGVAVVKRLSQDGRRRKDV